MGRVVDIMWVILIIAMITAALLWVAAIAFAMISDILSSIFAVFQSVLWEIYQRFRGE